MTSEIAAGIDTSNGFGSILAGGDSEEDSDADRPPLSDADVRR